MPALLTPVSDLLAQSKKSTREHPLCASQVALARRGELLAFETFGRAPFGGGETGGGHEANADNRTLFSIYSVTKALVSAASWILLQDEALALDAPVADYIPEFANHGKGAVTVAHLLTHTAGFPKARLPNVDWPASERRLQHFARWTLEWEPGTRFVYHGTATMWVLAELITRLSRVDYRDFVRTRITEPLGLENLYIGLPPSENDRVADVIGIGEPTAADDRTNTPVDAPVVDDRMMRDANSPASRAIGGPGGGAIATAADIALFYQGLLADADDSGARIWQSAILHDAWTTRNASFLDPMTRQPAMRGLGIVIAGSDGKMWRGFSEDCSPRAFGHMGAGGQISWADPETGLSFAFLTNGAHRDPVRQGANGYRLSTLAAACAKP